MSVSTPPTIDHVGLVQIELTQAHGQRRQRTGARGVDDAVGAAQVELVGNAPGDDVAEQAGKGGFGPRHVGVGDAIADGLRLVFGNAVGAQGVEPDRALQARAQVDDQFGGAGGAQDHADAALVDVLEIAAGRIFQHLLGNDQPKQLAGVGLLNDIRRNAKGHGVKGHFVQESAALAIGLVGSCRVGVVVVFDQPVIGWNFLDLVLSFDDAAPKTAHVAWSPERAH